MKFMKDNLPNRPRKSEITEEQIEAFFAKHPEKRLENQEGYGVVNSGITSQPLRQFEIGSSKHKKAQKKARAKSREAARNLNLLRAIATAKANFGENLYHQGLDRAQSRRAKLLEALQRDERPRAYANDTTLNSDIRILRQAGVKIVLCQSVDVTKSFYKIDDFERYKSFEAIGTDFRVAKYRRLIIEQLRIGKMLPRDNFDCGRANVAITMKAISKLEKMTIYSVMESKSIIGWAAIADKEEK